MGDKLQKSAMIAEIVVALLGLVETCWDQQRLAGIRWRSP